MKGKLIILSALIAISLIPSNKNEETNASVPIRTVETKYPKSSELIDNYYYDSKIETVDGNTCFRGKLNYSESNYEFIEEIAFDNLDSNDVIECKLEFNPDDMQFVLDLYLLDAYGEVEESERIVSDAFVNEHYRLDSHVVLNEDYSFYISDYYKQFAKDDCSIILIIAGVITGLIVTYFVVSETAEFERAEYNFEANKELEASGNGMWREGRVFNQHEFNYPGHNSAYYSFGFTFFDKVGCEAAAVYNLLLSLGRIEMLSETIHNFTLYFMEIGFAFGYLGSNPVSIVRYLNAYDIDFIYEEEWDSFDRKINERQNCKIIMSRWNADYTTGFHTFFIEKISGNFLAYNFEGNHKTPDATHTCLSEFNNGSGFIAGYII